MRYVIIAYLKHVKGYLYPYDFYICKDYETFCKNMEVVKKNMGIRYSYFESYKHIGLKHKWGFKL